MKIRVIGLGSVMVMGKIEQKNTGDYQEMKHPRVLRVQQEGNMSRVLLLNMVGEPEKILYKKDAVAFEYEPENKSLISSYEQETSGVIQPMPGDPGMPVPGGIPSNIIKMPGA